VIATALTLSGHAPTPTPGHRLPVREGLKATPAPTPAPPVAYPAGVLTSSQVAALASEAGWPPELIPQVVAIASRESGLDPRAVNASSGACGLMQLNPCPGPEALDPLGNLLLARSKCLAALAYWGDCLHPWRL